MNKRYVIEVATNKASLEKLKSDLSSAIQIPFDEAAQEGRIKGLTRSEKATIKNDLATLFGVADYQADALRKMVQGIIPSDTKGIENMKKQLQDTLGFATGIMQKMQEIGDATDWMKQGISFVDDFSKLQTDLADTQGVVKGLEKTVRDLTKSFDVFKDALAVTNSEAFLKRFGSATRSEAEDLAQATKELEKIAKTRNKVLQTAIHQGQTETVDFTGFSREEIEEEYKASIEIIKDGNKEIERLRKKYKGKTSDLYKDGEYIDQIGTISSELNRIKNMPGLDMDDIGHGLKASLKEATDSVKYAKNEIQNIIKDLQGKGIEVAITLPDASSTEFASQINDFVKQASNQFKKNPVEISVDLANPFKTSNSEDVIKELTKKQKELSDATANTVKENAVKSGVDIDDTSLTGLYSPDTNKISRNILNAFNNIYNIITAGQKNITAATDSWRNDMAEKLVIKPKFDASKAKQELKDTMIELQDELDKHELDIYTDTEALVADIDKALKEKQFVVDIKAKNIDGSGAILNVDNVQFESGVGYQQMNSGLPISQTTHKAPPKPSTPSVDKQTSAVTENSNAISDGTHAQKVLTDAINNLKGHIQANEERSKVLTNSNSGLTGEQVISNYNNQLSDISKRGLEITHRKKEIETLISEASDSSVITSLNSEFKNLENEWSSLYERSLKLQAEIKNIENKLQNGTYEDEVSSGQKKRDSEDKQNQKRIDAIQDILDNEKKPVELIVDELTKFWEKANKQIAKATEENDQTALDRWQSRAASMMSKGLGTIGDDGKYTIPKIEELETTLKNSQSLAYILSEDTLLKTLTPIKELIYFIPEIQKALGVMPKTEKEYIDEQILQARFKEILKINKYIETARGLLSEGDIDVNPQNIQDFIDYFGHIPEMTTAVELAKQYLTKVQEVPEELWKSEDPKTYATQIQEIWDVMDEGVKKVFLDALNLTDSVGDKKVTEINNWEQAYKPILNAYNENNSVLRELQTDNPHVQQILAILQRSSLLNSTKTATNEYGEHGILSTLFGLQKTQLVGNRYVAKDPIHITTSTQRGRERVFELNAGSGRKAADGYFNYSNSSLSKFFKKTNIEGEVEEIVAAMFDPIIVEKDRLESKIKGLVSDIFTLENTNGTDVEVLASKRQELAGYEQELAKITPQVNEINRTIQNLLDNLFASGKIKISSGKNADVPEWQQTYKYDKTKLAAYEKGQAAREKLESQIAKLESGKYDDTTLKALDGLSDEEQKTKLGEIIKSKKQTLARMQQVELTQQEVIQSLLVLEDDMSRADAKAIHARKESKQRSRKSDRVLDETQYDYKNAVKKQKDAIVNKDYYLSNLLSNIDFADENGLMDTSVLRDVAEIYKEKLAKAKSMPSRASAETDEERKEIDDAWTEFENARTLLLDTYFGTDGWNITRVIKDQFSVIDGELARKEQSIQAKTSDPQRAINAQMSEIAAKETQAKHAADVYADQLYDKYIREPEEKIQAELRKRSTEIEAKAKYTQDAKNNLESLADRDTELAQLKTELYNQMQKDPRFVELNELRRHVDVGSSEHKDYTNAIQEIENKYTLPYTQARAAWIESRAAELDAEYESFVQSIRDEAIEDATKDARKDFRAKTGSNVRSQNGMVRVIEQIKENAYKEAEAATMEAIANIDQSKVIPQEQIDAELQKEREEADLAKANALLKLRGKTDAELLSDIHATASENDAAQAQVYANEKAQKKDQLEKKMEIYGITKEMLDAERQLTRLEQERATEVRSTQDATEETNSAMQSSGMQRRDYGSGYVTIDTSDLAKEGTLRGIYELLNGGAPNGGWDNSISESSKTHGDSKNVNTGFSEINTFMKDSNFAKSLKNLMDNAKSLSNEHGTFISNGKIISSFTSGQAHVLQGEDVEKALNNVSKKVDFMLHNHPNGLYYPSIGDFRAGVELAQLDNQPIKGFGPYSDSGATLIDFSGIPNNIVASIINDSFKGWIKDIQKDGLTYDNENKQLSMLDDRYSNLPEEELNELALNTFKRFYDKVVNNFASAGYNDVLKTFTYDEIANMADSTVDTNVAQEAAAKVADAVIEAGVQAAVEQSKLITIPNGDINDTTAKDLSKEINAIKGKQDGGSALAGALNNLHYLGFTSADGYEFKSEDSEKLAKAYSQLQRGMQGTIVEQLDDGVQAYILVLQKQLETIADANGLDYTAINKEVESRRSSAKNISGTGLTQESYEQVRQYLKDLRETGSSRANEGIKQVYSVLSNGKEKLGNADLKELGSGYYRLVETINHEIFNKLDDQTQELLIEAKDKALDVLNQYGVKVYGSSDLQGVISEETKNLIAGKRGVKKVGQTLTSMTEPALVQTITKDGESQDIILQKAQGQLVAEKAITEEKKKQNNLSDEAAKKEGRLSEETKERARAEKSVHESKEKQGGATPPPTSNIRVPQGGNNGFGGLTSLAQEATLKQILGIISKGIKTTSGGKSGGTHNDDDNKITSTEDAATVFDSYIKKTYPNALSYDLTNVEQKGGKYKFTISQYKDLQAIEETKAAIAACEVGTEEWMEKQAQLNALQKEQEKITLSISAKTGEITTNSTFQNIALGAKVAEKELQNVDTMLASIHESGALSFDDNGSPTSSNQTIDRYLTSLKSLYDAYQEGVDNDTLFSPEALQRLSQLTLATQNYRKEVTSLLSASAQYNSGDTSFGSISGIDLNNYSAIKQSMMDVVAQNEKFKASFGELTPIAKNGQVVSYQLAYTLRTGKREVQEMTAALNPLTGELRTQKGAVKAVATGWDTFFNELKGKYRAITQYLMSITSIHDFIRYIRNGVQAIREIDASLTELKKVTDETDASYRRFLQNMANTGAVIGSTVKDLTSSAADWARLGYSMQEAGELAKNTSILMNVSEFEDVSKATDTLISALQAFKKEGQNVGTFSMEIIDKYNEVGK